MKGFIEEYKKLITHWKPNSTISESFRTLRTNLQFLGVKKNLQTLLITSSMANEGKTFIAANLAIIMGQSNKKTLFVDADLRRPSAYEVLQVKGEIGLSNYLAGQAKLEEVIQSSQFPYVDVVSSGLIPPNPAELLGSEEMETFIQEARKRYDKIIIDTPPTLAVADSAILSGMVDGCLLVFRAGKTDRNLVKKAKQQLENVNAPLLGLIMNDKYKNKKEKRNYFYGGRR